MNGCSGEGTPFALSAKQSKDERVRGEGTPFALPVEGPFPLNPVKA